MPQRVVIFTIGFHARATCRWLRRQEGREAVAFVDNNTAVHGTRVLGLPVLAPAALRSLDFDFVALPGRNQAPILAQLRDQLGISDDRVWLVRKSEVPPAAEELERRGTALASLLGRSVAVLEAMDARHWAMHSSLLGLVRGDDVARFSDFDFCVDAARIEELAERFVAVGLAPRAIPHRADAGPQPTRFAQLTLQTPTGCDDDEPALIDLHPLTLGATEASWPVNHGFLRLPVELFASSATRTYRDVAVRVPADPSDMLARLYGPDWAVPAETWNGRYHAPQIAPAACAA